MNTTRPMSASRERRLRRNERGSALAMAILSTTMLFGISTAYFTLSTGGATTASSEVTGVEAKVYADEGIQRSIAELKAGVDADHDGLGSLSRTGSDARTLSVVCTDLGGGLFRIHSCAHLRRANAGVNVVAQRIPPTPIAYSGRGAITANGPVTTTGNITVDGRDWNGTGTAIVGPGPYGISTTQLITNSGSSSVGGRGLAPARPPPAGSQEQNASWGSGYPSGPDVMLGMASGSLKSLAQAQGTYFTTQNALEAYVAANGGNVPGGAIVFADFATWDPVNLGGALNTTSSIIVHHTSTGMAQMKNLHGFFKGLVLCDFVQHLNGDFLLLGGLMSFGDQAFGNAFGNGNAVVKYSTQALSQLPAATTVTTMKIRSWGVAAAY